MEKSKISTLKTAPKQNCKHIWSKLNSTLNYTCKICSAEGVLDEKMGSIKLTKAGVIVPVSSEPVEATTT